MWRGRGEDVVRSETLGAAGGSAERCLRMWFLEKPSEEPPCGPATPPLGAQPAEVAGGLRYLHPHVHSNVIHKSGEVGATQVSVTGRAKRGPSAQWSVTQPEEGWTFWRPLRRG